MRIRSKMLLIYMKLKTIMTSVTFLTQKIRILRLMSHYLEEPHAKPVQVNLDRMPFSDKYVNVHCL